MNKKNIAEAVFLATLLIVITLAIILGVWDKGKKEYSDSITKTDTNTYYKPALPSISKNTASSNVVASSKTSDKYEMLEPFSLKVRGYHGNPILNPAMWSNPMTWMNPGNYMNLMHPSTWMNPANYMQMMNPMAYMNMVMYPMMYLTNPMAMMAGGQTGNMYMGMPNNPTLTTPNVMSPEQYEEWYNKQQQKYNVNN